MSTGNFSRPRNMRALRASKKSIIASEFNDINNCNESAPLSAQRSISLSALSQSAGPQSPLEPRMAQLETLEARMASIEVSLSTTPRRKNGKKSINGSTKSSPPPTKQPTVVDSCKELEMLRNVLRDKENTIQNLQGQVLSTPRPLDMSERRSADLRLQQLKMEEDMRKGNITRVSEVLTKMDADENNIDLRIRQAELEYELGREELALLGVREEKRVLQARMDAKPSQTLFSCLQPQGRVMLQAVSLEWDPKSPKFGAGHLDDQPGLRVLWAVEESNLRKGDRILEVNGKLTLTTSRDELTRLLSVCPSRTEFVVCRGWSPPPQATDDFLRRENLRLTHRISYLEDQVADLLNFKEKALTPQVEVFQKGSQVTVLSSPESLRAFRTPRMDPSDSDQSWRRGVAETVGPSQQYQENNGFRNLNEKERLKTKTDGVSTIYIQSSSDYERRRPKERTVDYSSETTCPRYRSHRDRSVKSLDLDADTSGQDTLTRPAKPQPPRKPLRLSIQRATSLQSMQLPGVTSKRSKHKSAAPPPPPPPHIEAPDTDSSYNAFRWHGHFHKNRTKSRTILAGEKWC